MEEIRKLSTILFADIAGYTAMMQKDERYALGSLNQFKDILEACVPEYKGTIVQYFGDGCLLSFESTTHGVSCALALQNSFMQQQIPVRIGMHLGEVVFKNNNAFGDGVNIASRVESMGVAGSIMVSKVIRDQIKNNSDFQLAPLGAYQFKNVETPMQIFAVANEGLTIPKRQEMKGKLKEEQGSLFQQLWKKRIPQILGVYILLAWLGVQLFDWALHQFGISPHWAQIFFITILGIIPSLLVYLNNRERLSQGRLKLREKILFPSNFILVGAVLFLMFRTSDLGATSKNITFTDVDGSEVSQTIIKDEFKKRFPVFPFEPMKQDSLHEWIGFALGEFISYKANQNKYISSYYSQQARDRVHTPLTKVEKIQRAQTANVPFYIDGQYQVIDDQYEYIPAVRNKKTGKVIKERRFVGKDPFLLMDSVGNFVLQSTGLSSAQLAENPDLSIREMASDDLAAIEHFMIARSGLGNYNKNMEKAIELDSTYAIAAVVLAAGINIYQAGKLEAKRLIDLSMRHRKRLPLITQIEVRVQKHLIYQEWEKAEQLLKLQLEIEPNNEKYNFALSNVYFVTAQYDKLVQHTEKWFARDPNPNTGFLSMMALLVDGQAPEVISRVSNFLLLDRQNVEALELLVTAYILEGELEKARESCEKIVVINPELEPYMSKTLEALAYMETHPIDQENLSKFVGYYRTSRKEQVFEYRLLNGLLYARGLNQFGFYRYPAGDKYLKTGKIYEAYEAELLLDSKGEVYGLKKTETRKEGVSIYYTWKQDSLIWQAEERLKTGSYEKAQAYYEKAIAQNPEHFYLRQAKQHIDYLQARPEAELLQNFQRFTGQYGEVNIWIEDGLLFYKRPGVTRRILRPISDNRFITLLNYLGNYEMVEQNGQVVGIQLYRYNIEKKEWEKTPNGYFDRTK
jgi:class 3 adenylate cyclase/tetratricopeptide (TPR) repeat protein